MLRCAENGTVARRGLRRQEWGDVAYMPLPMDVIENQDDLVIRVSIPGVLPEDVQVDVEGETVRIRAERKEEDNAGEYLLRERKAGRMGRTLSMPYRLDADRTDASLENGVLTLKVAKAESERTRTIPVRAK